MQAYLVLGCNGFNNNFCHCSSVKNIILDLEKIDLEVQEKILDFFDSTCELFDEIMTNPNKISNTLNLLHKNFNVFSVELLRNIQLFHSQHRAHGLYLALVLKEDYHGS
jgi:hypothetical protein